MAKKTNESASKTKLLTFANPAFRSHALALGQLALAWNGFHETLCILFCTVMQARPVNQFLAVWHAVNSDRTQREMLLAAAKSDIRGAQPIRFFDDIKWLCSQADVLEDARNDALHSPLYLQSVKGQPKQVLPGTAFGHKRAAKLQNKNVLHEFRWCRDTTMVLNMFAIAISDSLIDPMKPWPDRPKLPNRGHPNARKPLHQVPPAKSARQHQSSKT